VGRGGEEEQEKERGKGRGAHLGDPNPAITATGARRHKGEERERWERGNCAWEN
jgi:hypothetical protein